MKTIFTLSILFLDIVAVSAQWSNTTNLFADSLHMPVSTALHDQNKSLSIKSYPDSGYILYWEDYRNNNKVNVYAQKYDKAGHALWAADGVAVATGPDARHFYSSMTDDYRNYSYAVSDSSGGFYIAYLDDSNSNYSWQRVMVQHVRSNGTAVFPGAGFVVAATPGTETYNYARQQLIADGNKGFYIGFLKTGATQDVYVFCYRDENGTMKYYGGGQMDQNAYLSQIGSCSNYTLVERDAFASNYYIYPDLQRGCNVTMILEENAGGSERQFMGYNRLVRVKKASTVINPNASPQVVSYPRDSVLIYYNISYHTYIFQCGSEVGTGFVLDGNGYARLTDPAINQTYPKGVVIPTNGNINIDLRASDQRRYIDSNGKLTNYATLAYYGFNEKYDSIPYYFTVFPYEPSSFTGVPIPGINKMNYGQDTILYSGSYADYDFSLALTGNNVFVTAASYPEGGGSLRNILLQQLTLQKPAVDSFAIRVTSGTNAGIAIGKEVSTGFSGTDITYESPRVAAGSPGNALFYINEIGRSTRVSPIINATELAWGAMGRPIGSGRDINGYYYPVSPFVVSDPQNGTGVISWDDGRGSIAGQGENIYMRHMDSLNLVSYSPPQNGVKPLTFAQNYANPVTLLGTSNAWTTIEAISGNPTAISAVVQILDNYNLGAVQTTLYESRGALRSYNGMTYLDRNITIKPEHNPGGTGNISLRLFFTDAEFNALKAADPTITDPGSLAVIKQPNSTGAVPDSYTPVSGEEIIIPFSWKAVNGGYYIEMTVHGFSNFFIQKGTGPLPLTWLDINARWADVSTAAVSWQVADQQNVRQYIVQHSIDGGGYVDAGVVTAASDLRSYSCIVAASVMGKNEYRVVEQDLDGKRNYSKVVVLQAAASGAASLSLYPNPAKNILYIRGLSSYTEISIHDAAGRLLGHTTVDPAASAVNVTRLAKGVYFLQLETDRGSRTINFIKE